MHCPCESATRLPVRTNACDCQSTENPAIYLMSDVSPLPMRAVRKPSSRPNSMVRSAKPLACKRSRNSSAYKSLSSPLAGSSATFVRAPVSLGFAMTMAAPTDIAHNNANTLFILIEISAKVSAVRAVRHNVHEMSAHSSVSASNFLNLTDCLRCV